MPTATYIALANLTLSSNDASVEFASIPNTYRDLVLVIVGQATTSPAQSRMYINSDTGSNYTSVRMFGIGSGSGSSDTVNGAFGYIGDVMSSEWTPILVNFNDYSATDKHKTWLYRMNAAGNYVMAGASRWANTNAITTIKLELADSKSWVSGTTFALYGIVS